MLADSWYLYGVADDDTRSGYETPDGREISEEKYDRIEDTVFAGLEKKEAVFSWFSTYDLDRDVIFTKMNRLALMEVLTSSYRGFVIRQTP